jgi:hypothetical protein
MVFVTSASVSKDARTSGALARLESITGREPKKELSLLL